jgi:OOP family OmpA-OmpF porin
MQFNNLGTFLKPELSVLYSNADYQNGISDTDIFRTALNGVYEFPQSNIITPFVKAGVGYETMGNHQYDNHNGMFGDVGAGVKIALAKQIALKLEAIDMVKFNDFTWDNNILLLAGLNFAFGEKAQPAAPVVAAAVVAAPVIAPEPKPERVAVVAAPAAPICPVNVDSDKDGIFDPQDKCPNTPEGFKVDGDGCPLKATLHLNFITNGSTVDAAGIAKVKEFAGFMKNSPSYKATIVGHTDSTASDQYNQKLSEKRAQTVKALLIDQGIEASRLSASGEGEKMPVASNKTKQGRAENRRIEIELCK